MDASTVVAQNGSQTVTVDATTGGQRVISRQLGLEAVLNTWSQAGRRCLAIRDATYPHRARALLKAGLPALDDPPVVP